ncbi:MAG: Gfo/Idh/MocA family oxidoreductase, partial [Planctomycetes bacterium]|nr:Gfo/Idh/MocA family oxidoreductase [Planctomycetota bacterium]
EVASGLGGDIRVSADSSEWIDDVDAVSIVVPTPRHLDAARPFLEAGKGVLVEKPLASTLEQADEIIALAERHGATLQVGHIERFNPVLSAALPHIERPVFIECDRIHPFSLRSTDVSVILDLMIHDIDLILHVIEGEVTGVDALGARVLSPTDDLATARLVFASGCVAMVKTSRVAMNRTRKVRIFCERSYFSLDLVSRSGRRVYLDSSYDPAEFLDATGRIAAPDGEAAFLARYLRMEPLEIPAQEPLKAELLAFVDSVRSGSEPKVTGRAGRRAMQVAGEIDASIRHHRERVQGYLSGE